MRRVKVLGLCGSVVFALCGLCTQAVATSPPLLLKAQGKTLPAGSPVKGSVYFYLSGAGSCELGLNGALTSNGQPTDTASFTGYNYYYCEGAVGGHSGFVEEIQLTSKGKLTVKASPPLTVEAPGPCVYEIKTFKGKVGLPGTLLGVALSGKFTLNRTLSAATCTKKIKAISSFAALWDPETLEYLQAEI